MWKVEVKCFRFHRYSNKEVSPFVAVMNVPEGCSVDSCVKSFVDSYNEKFLVWGLSHYEILRVYRGD
ncbi:hypothetical protein AALH12_07055 [Streptococcus ferus]|uniref:hypothetical protein n=1 Tax=Streptococcus ferus TaxID=1345 RepID=UPI003514929D